MEIIGFIYKITNKISGKIYIGQKSSKDFRNQFQKYWGSGIVIKEAIKKYGKENFDKEIIYEAFSIEELNRKEIYYIDFYKSLTPSGYNISEGGNGFMNRGKSEEELKEIYNRQSMTCKNRSIEEKQDISDRYSKSHIGISQGRDIFKDIDGEIVCKRVHDASPYLKDGWEFGNGRKGIARSQEFIKKMIGRKVSEETRQKISKSLTNVKHPKERIEKMKKSLTGRKLEPFSKEHKKKISDANKGKKKSEEHRKNMSKSRPKNLSEKHRQNIGKSHLGMKYNKKLKENKEDE